MNDNYLKRLTATLVLLAGLTAAVIVSTPGVSPVVAARQGAAMQTVQGGVFTALAVAALLALVLGSRVFSELLIVVLPVAGVINAEFAALVVPSQHAMVLVLLALPPLAAHAVDVYGAAELRQPPFTDEVIRNWHPWARGAVLWVREQSRHGWFGRLATAWLDAEDRHPAAHRLPAMVGPVAGGALAAWIAVEFGLINARPSNGVPVLAQVLFALTAVLILFAAPAVGYLAIRAEEGDGAAAD
jgi:hypothetical protein